MSSLRLLDSKRYTISVVETHDNSILTKENNLTQYKIN